MLIRACFYDRMDSKATPQVVMPARLAMQVNGCDATCATEYIQDPDCQYSQHSQHSVKKITLCDAENIVLCTR